MTYLLIVHRPFPLVTKKGVSPVSHQPLWMGGDFTVFFSRVGHTLFPEDTTLVLCLYALFSDSSEPITYRISSGDPEGKFSIHRWLGSIRTLKPLDHEAQPMVVLTVQAQLGSSPACSSTEVNITVMDVNDNRPEFPTASDEIRISQTTPPGTALYLARAQDRDSGLNGLVRYSIASPQPSEFSMDQGRGVLYLRESLGSKADFRLILVAKDQGVPPQVSQLVLTVVIESQERIPAVAFENLVYQVEVSESLPLTTQILQVQAYPLYPWRPTSKTFYSLDVSVDSAVFGIHPHTGWIYLRRQLDYEFTQTYKFRVYVHTSEDRLLQNVSTSVIVHVLDENDHSPAFLQNRVFLNVEESPIPLGVIGKMTAIDADSGKNGQLSYFLLTDGKFFKMNPNTGSFCSSFHPYFKKIRMKEKKPHKSYSFRTSRF